MLVRPILWLVFGFLAYTLFKALRQMLLKPPSKPPEKTARGEEMMRDPVCGTYVPRNDAIQARIGGEDCFFCSTECRDKYRSNFYISE